MYLDPQNIPKTPCDEVFECIGEKCLWMQLSEIWQQRHLQNFSRYWWTEAVMVTPLLSSIDSFQLSPYKDSIAQRGSDLNKLNKNSYPKNPKGTSQQILGMHFFVDSFSLFFSVRSLRILWMLRDVKLTGFEVLFRGVIRRVWCFHSFGVRILEVNLP